jgi:hypothetical protein
MPVQCCSQPGPLPCPSFMGPDHTPNRQQQSHILEAPRESSLPLWLLRGPDHACILLLLFFFRASLSPEHSHRVLCHVPNPLGAERVASRHVAAQRRKGSQRLALAPGWVDGVDIVHCHDDDTFKASQKERHESSLDIGPSADCAALLDQVALLDRHKADAHVLARICCILFPFKHSIVSATLHQSPISRT